MSEQKKYSRSLQKYDFESMKVKRASGSLCVVQSLLLHSSLFKLGQIQNRTQNASIEIFLLLLSVFFGILCWAEFRCVFTESRTCAGCAPVAGQHAGKRLSAPWGRPASCLWSPPLAADGSGSSLPGGRTRPSGSVSWCRRPRPGPSSLRRSSAGSLSPWQRHLGQETKWRYFKKRYQI